MPGRKIFSLFGSLAIEGMGKTRKDLTELDLKARAFNKRMNRLGRDMNKVGKSLTKNLTLPLLAASVAAIKFGADFDQAMTNSLAIMGDVSDAMRKDLEGAARDVAKTTKASATEAAEAYFFLASAGLSAAESLKALPVVGRFAQAGNFNLAQATDLLTDAQSALGLSSENIEERMENMAALSDVLVKANTIANASVQQFSESLTNKAGAALRLLNKDVEEGAAVLAVYADQGVKGADAGTQLNIVLRDLQKASIGNRQGFKDAGIAVFDAEGNMRNMADIVEDLENRLGGMSDEQKQAELTTLGFTSKSIAATKALIGTSDALRDYEKQLRDAGGITKEVADKQLKTFWAQLGLLKDQAIDLALTFNGKLGPVLVDTIIPALKDLIKVVESVMEWFGKHKVIAQFVASFVGVLAVAGPIVLMFVKLLPLIKGLYLGYQLLIGAQLTLNASMAANPIGLIVLAVAALTAATVVLVKNWATVKKVFFDVWDGIKFHFANVASAIGIAYSKLILGILKGVQKVGRFVPGLNRGLKNLIMTYENSISTMKHMTKIRKAHNAEQKAANALTGEEAKLVDEGTESIKEKGEEEEETGKKKKKLTLEQIAAAKRLATERGKFEEDYTERVAALSRNRIQAIEAERSEALAAAKKLGADTSRVNEFFDAKAETARQEIALEELNAAEKLAAEKLAIEKVAAAEEVRIAKETSTKKQQAVRFVLGTVSTVVNGINKIWAASLNKRTAEIDQETEARVASVEASTMTEEAKVTAIEEINTEAEAKKLELQRENAKREKAAALFGITLSTAMAVASALTIPVGGIALAAIVGALGLVQLGIAAATPLPLAKGALVRSTPGRGVIAQVGEGKEDELVLPMKTGAAELANNIIGKISTAGVNVQSASRVVREVHQHFHIGTFIGDEFGVKALAKRIRPYTIAEDQRTGA